MLGVKNGKQKLKNQTGTAKQDKTEQSETTTTTRKDRNRTITTKTFFFFANNQKKTDDTPPHTKLTTLVSKKNVDEMNEKPTRRASKQASHGRRIGLVLFHFSFFARLYCFAKVSFDLPEARATAP